MVSTSKLPAEWSYFNLSVISDLKGGKTPSKSNDVYWNSPDVFWASPKDMKKTYLTDTKDKISSEATLTGGVKIYPAGSILFVVRSGILKHTFPVCLAKVPTTVNQDLKVIEPLENMNCEFLLSLMRSRGNDFLNTCSKQGTTVDSIELNELKRFILPLPPLAEQKVIADKLDTLLAQVEITKARLERIPEILKRFRQSVLAAAVSGKLTKIDNVHRIIKTLGDAGVTVKTGPFGSALHKSEYVNGGVSLINPMHINDGKITPSNHMTVTKDKFSELEAWELKEGDVILGRRGEMGRAAVVRCTNEKMICGTGSMILRGTSNVLPDYLCMILRSPVAIEYFNKDSVGSTMVNLNQKVIKSLEVYFPLVEEQTQIVRRVEELFTFADSIEQKTNAALERVNNLTQSILAKAFRGELTADWRAANPELISGENSAEALLDKIKAERAALAPKKSSRAKKNTQAKQKV